MRQFHDFYVLDLDLRSFKNRAVGYVLDPAAPPPLAATFIHEFSSIRVHAKFELRTGFQIGATRLGVMLGG